MRTKALLLTLCIAVLGKSEFLNLQAKAQSQGSINSSVAPRAIAYHGGLPLTFEANQGQTAAQVKFLSRGKGYTAFLTANGMVLSLHPATAITNQSIPQSASATPSQTTNTPFQFTLIGSATNPTAVGEDPQPGHVNYFIGNNPTHWHTNVATYARVRYRNVYPGIDLVYYGTHRQLEYDFAISPGADPSIIQFEIKGADSVSLDSKGDLVLSTNNGQLHFQHPVVYQESNGVRVPVKGEYVMKDSTHIGFQVSSYDYNKPTVIDPALLYATYLGGSGEDQATGLAVDASGNVYVTGSSDSTNFPLATLGSLPATDTHVFIAKLDATGSNLVYADYIGGNSDDYGYALALDSANEVYVTGSTASSDFPVVNAYQSTYPGSFNAFITKLSADGSSLLYSTYFGGNGSDMPASIALDSSSDLFIAGNTSSTNFPAVNAYQSTASANQGGLHGNYGFVSKFTPDGSELIYSTYFGGNSNVAYNCGGSPCWSAPFSAITGLALDSSGNAYVGGNTNTYNFPISEGAYQTTNPSSENGMIGFVGKFGSTGALAYSTYLSGTSGNFTNINAITVDSSASAYVTGSAISDGTFPVTSTTICDPSASGSDCEFAFVTKLNNAGSTLLYSTFLGLNNMATAVGISLDSSNDAYILASTSNNTFETVNGIETFSTQGTQYVPGDNDLLLVEIDPNAGSELFATYLGGSGNDMAGTMAIDAVGNIYVAGTTDSSDFPVSQSAFQQTLSGNTDAFIAKIGPGEAAAVSMAPFSLEYSAQAVETTSSSQTVLLRNMSSSGLAISSITTTGDFAQTNDCGASVPAASSCKLLVTFTPTAAGTRSGSITMVDSGLNSPHLISLSGIGSGAVVAFTPTALTFSATAVGTASTQQTVNLANNGNVSLSIGSITISGDYSQTNNCGTSLAAGSNCQIQIAFTPTATGTRNGGLTLIDDAQDSPQALALTGIGEVEGSATITISPSALSFAGQVVDSASDSQLVTLINVGNSPVTVSNIAVNGDFSQTNNCGVLAASVGTCSVSVIFAPSVSGSRVGTLTISNSKGSTQTVSLTGSGVDFSLTVPTTTDTILAGGSATYSLIVTPVGGTFSDAIQLNCGGLPAEASCSFSPSVLTPKTTSVSVTLTVATTATVAQTLSHRSLQRYGALGILIQFPTLSVFGILFAEWTPRSKKLVVAALLVLLIAGTLLMSACAGGTGTASQPQMQTTSKSYAMVVTGTSGTLQHSVPLTLTVQQN